MGEMFSYYAACDVVFIGGSLLPFGSQNLIEACAVGRPVLIGPHTYNFEQAAAAAITAGAVKTDIAITPLAIPMLAGPGAISTAIVLEHQATDWYRLGALCLAIIAVSVASFLTLRFAAQGARWLNPIAMRIITRVMGLLLAAVAIQFLINGLKALKGDLL